MPSWDWLSFFVGTTFATGLIVLVLIVGAVVVARDRRAADARAEARFRFEAEGARTDELGDVQ